MPFHTLTRPAGTSQGTGTQTANFSQTGLTAGRGLLVFVDSRDGGSLAITTCAFSSGSDSFTAAGTSVDGRRLFFCPTLESGGTRTIVVGYDNGVNGYDLAITTMEVSGHDVANMVPTVSAVNTQNPAHIAITTQHAGSSIIAFVSGGNNDGGSSSSPIAYSMLACNSYSRARLFYASGVGSAAAYDQAVTEGWWSRAYEIKAAPSNRTVVTSPNPYTFTLSDGVLATVDSTNWQEVDGYYGYISVLGNVFRNAYTNLSYCRWKGTFAPNQYAEIKAATVSGTSGPNDCVGVMLRSSGTSSSDVTGYVAVYYPTSPGGVYKVVKVSGTTRTQVGTDITGGQVLVAGDKFSAEAITNGASVDIKLYYDTGSGPTLIGTRTDSSSPYMSGTPGVAAGGTNDTAQGDDFVAGNLLGYTQRLQAAGNFGDAAATVSKAFVSDVTAGSLIVVCAHKYDSAGNVPFVAGDCTKIAGTATIDTPQLDKATSFDVGEALLHDAIWSCLVTAGGSLTIQVGGMGASSYSFLTILEFAPAGSWDASRVEAAPAAVTTATNDPASMTCTSYTSAGAAVSVGLWGGDGTTGGGSISITETTGILAYEEFSPSFHLIGAVQSQIAGEATAFAPSWNFGYSGGGTIYGGIASQVVYKSVGGEPPATYSSPHRSRRIPLARLFQF
jgi:hypothetical protein